MWFTSHWAKSKLRPNGARSGFRFVLGLFFWVKLVCKMLDHKSWEATKDPRVLEGQVKGGKSVDPLSLSNDCPVAVGAINQAINQSINQCAIEIMQHTASELRPASELQAPAPRQPPLPLYSLSPLAMSQFQVQKKKRKNEKPKIKICKLWSSFAVGIQSGIQYWVFNIQYSVFE